MYYLDLVVCYCILENNLHDRFIRAVYYKIRQENIWQSVTNIMQMTLVYEICNFCSFVSQRFDGFKFDEFCQLSKINFMNLVSGISFVLKFDHMA